MKKHFIKTMLLALLCAVGGVGAAWADEKTSVGAVDNSSGFFSDFSDYYTIASNQTLTLNFKNYSSKEQNFHNWILAVTNDYDRGTKDEKDVLLYNEYLILRADNFGWGSNYASGTLSSNYNWDTFKNDMDGSSVTMTIERMKSVVTVNANITTVGGNSYFEKFVMVVGVGQDPIRAFLSIEKAHLTDITSSITDTEIVPVTTPAIYERGTALMPWYYEDIADWTRSSGSVSRILNDQEVGIKIDEFAGELTNSKINYTQGYLLDYDIVWNVGASYGATKDGTNNNTSYLKIGDKIAITTSSQGQSGIVTIDGTDYTIANACKKNNNRDGDQWTIHLTVNTTKNTVSALTIVGRDGNNKVNFTLPGEVAFNLEEEAVFNSNVIIGVTRVATTQNLWTAIKSIVVTESEYVEPVVVNNDITNINVTYDYNTQDALDGNVIAPFDNGTVMAGTNVKALTINNTTATAWFDSDAETDGRQPYSIAANEKVNIFINAYHGWLSSGKGVTVTLYAPEGKSLASYIYNVGSCQITDVKIGGNTVDGFTSFGMQSANGLDGKGKPYAATGNPEISISISGSGYVEMTFSKGETVLGSYSATLDKESYASLEKITITNPNDNGDRAYHIGKLSISSEQTSDAMVTYKFEDTNGNSLADLKADLTAPGTIGKAIAEIIPEGYKNSFFNGDETVKYVYDSFTCSDETLPAAGTTVILKFAANTKFTYNVNAVDGGGELLQTIATVSGFPGDVYSLYWSKYIKVGEQWYVADAPFYQGEITAEGTKEVTYTPSEIAYFIECEKMYGVRSDRIVTETNANNSGYYKVRINNYYPTIWTDVFEEGGRFDLTLPYNNSNSSNHTYQIRTRDANGTLSDVIAEWTCANGNQVYTLKDITIPAGSSLAISCDGISGNSNARMDYLTLTPHYNSYTVQTNEGIVIASGSCKDGEDYSVVLPEVVADGGKFYVLSDESVVNYTKTFTMATDGEVQTINYTEDPTIVYYTEGTGISYMNEVAAEGYSAGNYVTVNTSANHGNARNRGYSVGNLAAGQYEITASIVGSNGRNICVRTNDGDYNSGNAPLVSLRNAGIKTGNFALGAEKAIVITGANNGDADGAKSGHMEDFDYIIIRKTSDVAAEIVNVTDAGYATYYSENPLDFTGTGLTAYIAEVNGSAVSFTEVTSVPAKTGVLVKGDKGAYTVNVVSSSTDVSTNAFVGVLDYTKVKNTGIYVLMNGANGVGFYKTTADAFTVSARTAYLPATASGRAFIGFDDETTGIKTVSNAAENNGMIFNLNGQRVSSPKGGLYIKNGKKVIIK